ncbi:LysM peptidoglycan-binding domain-containing M23 family metallopeptidase [Gammaproteobacteria bacterium]|nr:LysM peptidoglycan-binding domain-containing M23 family metallopeptidase [Gammaproteobacteria bacterium]
MRVLILVAFILSSCSSNINLSGMKNLNFLPLERSSYKVKKGDTLWTIAIKSNNDPLRIAKKNNLKKPYTIYPGQNLDLRDLDNVKLDKKIISPRWKLPTLKSTNKKYEGSYWLIFNGLIGDPVFTVLGGTVVISGSSLPGYGNFMMIDHGKGYLSIYAHCDKLFVSKGQKVIAGQQIATIGSSEINRPTLKFQIRKSGAPLKVTNLKFY